MDGYEIHGNVETKLFPKNIALLLKPYIKQYYLQLTLEKEWGITITQLYKKCLSHDIIAFGLQYHQKHNGIVLSIIGYNQAFNFHTFYHTYKEIKTKNTIVLVFPFTMILNVDTTDKSCISCSQPQIKISKRLCCQNESCNSFNIKIEPRDLVYHTLVFTLDQAINHKWEQKSIKNTSCKYCVLNKVHKICSYNRHRKKLRAIKSQLKKNNENNTTVY